MSFDTFPTVLTTTRLQNAAEVMLQYGFLRTKLDTAPMLQPGPAS